MNRRSLVLGVCLLSAGPLMAALAPDDSAALLRLQARATDELRFNILPFWLKHVPHPERGGFYGEVMRDGTPRPGAPRAALMTSRILWTFSAAHRAFGDPTYRQMADRAYHDLRDNFTDHTHGGIYWSITAAGAPHQTFKHVYGQVFALYGLVEYHRATQEPAALEEAIALFRLLESRARDNRHGGYFEAFTREWQRQSPRDRAIIGPPDAKSQNTHLHIMEAYANLLRAWPEPSVRQAQRHLILLMLDRVVDAETAHLGLFFDDDWTRRSRAVSYGHDIEFAWLVTEAATELGDAELLARVRPLAVRVAEVTLAEGVAADGGIPYEAGLHGVTDPRREWWVPAEAAIGFINAYQLSGDDRFLRAALTQWEFIERRLIDREHGEWHHSVGPDGALLGPPAKASGWKCPYHNGRACLELAARAASLLAK